ncbi:MAG: transporter [Candidatus Latescibacteria bacterium]|nr:transporter [Candidatus Latescibacterota bacterium]
MRRDFWLRQLVTMMWRSLMTVSTMITAIGVAQWTWAQGPPIHTETAFVTGLNGAAFKTAVKVMRKSTLLRDGEEVPDPFNREVRVTAVPLMLPYELLPNRLVVAAAIPYMDKELKLTKEGVRQSLSDAGFGDLILVAKYQIFQRDAPGKTIRVTLKGGVKLPTGDDEETDDVGNPLPKGLQLGSGSVDYLATAIFTHSLRRFGINTDVGYTVKTEAKGFVFGDVLNYDLAFGYRIYPSLYERYPQPYSTVYLEVNGQYSREDTLDGEKVPDSGGHTLLLSPGLQFVPFGSLAVEASVQVPVVQNLHGTQLGTGFIFTAGLLWLVL